MTIVLITEVDQGFFEESENSGVPQIIASNWLIFD